MSRPSAIDALHAAVKKWPSDNALREAERIVTSLCVTPGVEAVVIFGSAIRRDVRSFDLDLLYIYSGARPDPISARMEVDLRGYRTLKVNEMLANGHDLLCWSIKFGEVVCERDDFWSNLRTEWLGKIRMPSVTDAGQRAIKAWKIFADLLQVGDYEAALEQYVTFLTHETRAALIEAGVYPASRPELPDQLRSIGALASAARLEHALRRRLLLSEGHDARVSQFLLASHDSMAGTWSGSTESVLNVEDSKSDLE